MDGGLAAPKRRPIRIEMPGLDRLCVEHVGPAPNGGMELVRVAHDFERAGDLMAGPEVVFEVDPADWREGPWRPASIPKPSPDFFLRQLAANGESTENRKNRQF